MPPKHNGHRFNIAITISDITRWGERQFFVYFGHCHYFEVTNIQPLYSIPDISLCLWTQSKLFHIPIFFLITLSSKWHPHFAAPKTLNLVFPSALESLSSRKQYYTRELILPRIKLRKMSHSIQYTVYGWYFAWYLFKLKCSDCAALVRERGGLVLVRSHRHLKPSFRKTPQIPSPAPLNWSRAQRAPEKTISLIGDEKTNRFLWESVPIPDHRHNDGGSYMADSAAALSFPSWPEY